MAEIINIRTKKPQELALSVLAPVAHSSAGWPEEMGLREAAAYCRSRGFRMSEKTLYNLIYKGEGPEHEKVGAALRFKRRCLDAWLKHRTTTRRAYAR